MKKLITILTILFLVLSINAQEIISSQKAKRVKNHKGSGLIYAHENVYLQEVKNRKINIYKDGRKVGNQNFNKKIDGYRTSTIETIYSADRITRLFIIKIEDRIELYSQKYDLEYNPIGEQMKFAEIDIDSDSYYTAYYSDYNEKTGNILIASNTVYNNAPNQLKVFLFDEYFQELNSIKASTSSNKSKFEVVVSKVLPDDKALLVISEYEQETSGYTTKKTIYAYNMVAFSPLEDPKINLIQPDQNKIIRFSISDNIFENKVLIAIQSQMDESNSEEQKEDVENNILGVYTFDFKTTELSRKSYPLDAEIDKTRRGIGSIRKIIFDKEGYSYFVFQTIAGSGGRIDYGSFTIKLDKKGDYQWGSPLIRKDISGPKYRFNGYLVYVNDNNELEVIFNSKKNVFKKGEYEANNSNGIWFFHKMGVSKKNIPIKATFNSNSGEVDYKRILENENVNSMTIKNAVETKEKGVYYVIHNIGGKTVVSAIDFKSK